MREFGVLPVLSIAEQEKIHRNIHPTAVIGDHVTLGNNVTIGPYVILHDHVTLQDNCIIEPFSIIGTLPTPGYENPSPTIIGANSHIRSHCNIYCGLRTGENFETGNEVILRENVTVGRNTVIGPRAYVRQNVKIGHYCRIKDYTGIGEETVIHNFVWIFPGVIITNDPYPPSVVLKPVTIRNFAVIATQAVLMPGVTIGEDALVGAKARVKEDVPDGMLVKGDPGKVICPTATLTDRNKEKRYYPWRLYYDQGMPWQGEGFETWVTSGENRALMNSLPEF